MLDTQPRKSHKTHELTLNLWLKGGFPNSFMAKDGQVSLEWRSQYIDSILGPHSPPRNNVEKPDLLFPLWERITIEQGKCNIQQLPAKLGCNKEIMSKLLSFLESENLIRQVRPWHSGYRKRLDQNPIWFIRDSGLLHSQLNVKDIHTQMQIDAMGKSWEGFVLESIMSSVPHATEVFYYRDDNLFEADFILEFDASQRWVVEVKFNGRRSVSRGFYKAREVVEPERQFVIHGGPESFRSGNNSLDYFCLYDAICNLKSIIRH